MTISFHKATRTQKKLRMALMGPSGSGKTYTALILAAELGKGGKVALLDTERGSASLYSDNFEFDACQLESFNPQHYIDGINAAAAAGYTVLVIDSLSHAWNGEGGVLDQVNKRGGNQFTDGWGKVGTPLQNSLMKAILEAPMHVIATMRVKTEYVVEQNERGKSAPKRVGLAAVQRDGVEYEFDIIGTLDLQNTLTIEKTRMTALAGTIVTKPDAKLAQKIMGWLSDGAPAPPQQQEVARSIARDLAEAAASIPTAATTIENRAKGMVAMNLVEKTADGYTVTNPGLDKQDKYMVWRENGKIQCGCEEFIEGIKTNAAFRCVHILSVKFFTDAHQQPATASAIQFPKNPLAQTRSDLITSQQFKQIGELSQQAGVDTDAECMRLMTAKTDELSKQAAGLFIQHLASLPQQQQSETASAR